MLKPTKARLKLDQILRGKKTNFRVAGCLVFKEWDASDRKFYYWEEWELLGFEDYDSWVEYDHYSGEVSIYEPLSFKENVDPSSWVKQQTVTLQVEGEDSPCEAKVKEVGEGVIHKIIGKNTYQVFEGEKMNYAVLGMASSSGKARKITVEKYNNREYDIYEKRVLSKAEQKEIFGKVLVPFRNWDTVLVWFIVALFFLPMIFGMIHDLKMNSKCEAERKAGRSSVECNNWRVRSVTGGGSGGFGK